MRIRTIAAFAALCLITVAITGASFVVNAAITKGNPELEALFDDLARFERPVAAKPRVDWEVVDRTSKGDRQSMRRAHRFYTGPRCSALSRCPPTKVI